MNLLVGEDAWHLATVACIAVDSTVTDQLTVLGGTVRHAIEHVEVFPAPAHVTTVRFTTDELASMCPVTQQPDLSNVVIEYSPNQRCIASGDCVDDHRIFNLG